MLKYPKRMLKLASLLEKDAKNKKGLRFDISYWGTVKYGSEPGLNCGTTACGMGLAVLSGAFKRYGLSVAPPRTAYDQGINFRWRGRALSGFRAAEKLFGIKNWDSESLFGIGNQKKIRGAVAERMLAQRLRDFVKENR